MRVRHISCVLLIAAALFCVVAHTDAAKHVWEVQKESCLVRRDCATVVIKGNMHAPDGTGKNKWDFGTFDIHKVYPHSTRVRKDNHWKVTVVDRKQASKVLRRLRLPGDSKYPIKMCCLFFDKRNPTIRCKVNDYLQNVVSKDSVTLLFGPRRPKADRLYNRLPPSGPVDLEIQDKRRKCPIKAGSKIVTVFASKAYKGDKSKGLAFELKAKKAVVSKLSTDVDWLPTLGRIDGNDIDEEPERLCCTVSDGKLECLAKPFFKRVTKGSLIQVWVNGARRPKRNRLAQQMKCQGFPQSTPQGWSPLAFPDPIPEYVAHNNAKKADAVVRESENFSRL